MYIHIQLLSFRNDNLQTAKRHPYLLVTTQTQVTRIFLQCTTGVCGIKSEDKADQQFKENNNMGC